MTNKQTITVAIRTLTFPATEWVSVHNTGDYNVALTRAIHKHFGRSRSWFPDYGRNQGMDKSNAQYGQIGHSMGGAGNLYTMDTPTVEVSFSYGGL